MKKAVLIITMTLAGSVIAGATPVCVTGDVASYVALGTGGCTIGPITFFNFQFVDVAFSGDVAPKGGLTSTEAQISPLIDANGFGFTLTPLTPWSAEQGGVTDADLSYQAIASDAIINDLFLSITGSAGLGSFAAAQETYCPDGTSLPPECFAPDTPQITATIHSGSNVTVAKHATFDATSAFAASKDIEIDARAFNASDASVTSVINQLSTTTTFVITDVPEPATLGLLLIGFGFLGMGLAGRARRCRD